MVLRRKMVLIHPPLVCWPLYECQECGSRYISVPNLYDRATLKGHIAYKTTKGTRICPKP